MSAPNTTIEIIDVPLLSTQEHTYRFSSMVEQTNFFSSRVKTTFSSHLYARRNAVIKVQPPSGSWPLEWKYCRVSIPVDPAGYQRRFYYFIEKVEYINDALYALYIKLDVLQTYMFAWSLEQCFIERRHPDNDIVGLHTIDEGLETGELINAHEYNVEGLQEMAIVIQSGVALNGTITGDTTPDVATAERFDNMFSGLGVYAVDLEDWMGLSNLLQTLSENGAIDGIVNMYMYPKNLLVLKDGQSWGDGTVVHTVSESGYTFPTLASYTNYTSKLFGGYQPKNNKLYTYPYNFLYLTNNQGGTAEYKYERFRDMEDSNANALSFQLYGGLSHDAGVFLHPSYYNGGGYEYGLALGNYPGCAWNADTYKVWLAQNYHTLQNQGANAVLTAGGGVAAMAASAFVPGAGLGGVAAGAGMVASGLSQVNGLMAQKRDMAAQPPQARGAHSATVNTNAMRQTFTFYYKTLSAENAKQIDDYFTRYGYKQQTVETPSIYKHRRGFCYLKTSGCAAHGRFGSEDANEINAIFDRGVTFWDVYKIGDDYHEWMGQYSYDPCSYDPV